MDPNTATNIKTQTQPADSNSHPANNSDIDHLTQLLQKPNIPEDLRNEGLRILDRVKQTTQATGFSKEYEVVRKYIEWVTQIPWGQYSEDSLELDHVKQVLDQSHYGIEKVKERVLEYLAIMRMAQSKGEKAPNSPIFCFVGLQGIGKTTMAKAIAKALGRKFIRVSLGAMSSVTEIRGKPKTESDAEPGQIIKALVKAQTLNPVILLDELDKASAQQAKRTDIMSALLEILDPEQNTAFRDHYIDYPVDLSHVMFICTANNLGTITTALLDRLEVIRFFSYSDEEKAVIGKQYLLPKVLNKAGLSPQQLVIDESVWPTIIRPLGYDAGVRQLERNLQSIARKAARIILQGTQQVVINDQNVREFIQEAERY